MKIFERHPPGTSSKRTSAHRHEWMSRHGPVCRTARVTATHMPECWPLVKRVGLLGAEKVPVDGGDLVAGGDPDRGSGLLSPDPDHGETGPAALAFAGQATGSEADGSESGDRQAPAGPELRAGDRRPLRDRVAWFLCLPPGGWDRAVGQRVPAGQSRASACSPQSDDPFERQRVGLYRPRQSKRVPRQIPDEVFNELFARLSSDRDRALVAFWVSTGARAAELLGALRSGADAGQQLITVVRKGSRAMQQLPASPDALVWLRLYQQQTHGLVPAGPDDPLWWTLQPSR